MRSPPPSPVSREPTYCMQYRRRYEYILEMHIKTSYPRYYVFRFDPALMKNPFVIRRYLHMLRRLYPLEGEEVNHEAQRLALKWLEAACLPTLEMSTPPEAPPPLRQQEQLLLRDYLDVPTMSLVSRGSKLEDEWMGRANSTGSIQDWINGNRFDPSEKPTFAWDVQALWRSSLMVSKESRFHQLFAEEWNYLTRDAASCPSPGRPIRRAAAGGWLSLETISMNRDVARDRQTLKWLISWTAVFDSSQLKVECLKHEKSRRCCLHESSVRVMGFPAPGDWSLPVFRFQEFD